MSLKYTHIIIVSLLFLCISTHEKSMNTSDSYTLNTAQKTYVAGSTVSLKFNYKGNANTTLYCSNSYGSVLVNPVIKSGELTFTIPQNIANKAGVLNWQLLTQNGTLIGALKILPKPKIETIESYLGPPSIEAGGTDYTMLVTIPTDDLDNALADNTSVNIKHHFLNTKQQSNVTVKKGIAYKNITSFKQSGRIIISSECLDITSKEYDVNAMPAIPTNFSISASRIHQYADGNQMATFKTSVIKDRFNNIVSDGTFVTFFITNSKGYKSKTSGSTINGIATAKMLHPDHEDTWTVKAYIEGIANSINTMTLNYKQAVSDFEVTFSENQRTITIGPIKSFMNQRIPDGLAIHLNIYKNDTINNTILERTYNGLAEFKLNPDRYPNGIYTFKIEAAGFLKTFNNVTCK